MADESIRVKRLTQTLANLTKLLDCPVCFERITPPVITCINGHGVCINCRKQLLTCPTCKAGFSTYKNTMIDQIIEENIFPCRYTDKGCQVENRYRELQDHEQKECKFRTILCAIQDAEQVEPCCTEVSMYRYYEHVLATHATESINLAEEYHRIIDISKPIERIHILKDAKTSKVVLETVKLDKIVQKFYVTCQYVDTGEEAAQHTYELRIYNRNERHKELRFKNLCVPIGLKDEDLQKYERVLVMDACLLKGFTHDERLFYSIKIEELPRSWYQAFKRKCKIDKMFACGV